MNGKLCERPFEHLQGGSTEKPGPNYFMFPESGSQANDILFSFVVCIVKR